MMRCLTHIDAIDTAAWEALLEVSSTGSWFQSPQAYNFYATLPDVLTPYVAAVECSGELRALALGYLPKAKYGVVRYFSQRCIVLGGVLMRSDVTSEELSLLLSTLRCELQGLAIYIELRNFTSNVALRQVYEACGYVFNPHYDVHVKCSSVQEFEQRMRRSKLRQLREALASGAQCGVAESEEEVRELYRLFVSLYRRRIAKPLFAEAFFVQFFKQGIGPVFVVKHEGKIVGGMLCPLWQGRVLYEWFVVGLDREYKRCRPSIVATASAISYGITQGVRYFDFMGAGTPDKPYGVRRFKHDFAGTLLNYGRYVCVNSPWRYRLGQWALVLFRKIVVR